MNPWIKILIAAWFVLISVLAVVLTIYDKVAAKRGNMRIPEKTLLFVSVLGGAAAMFFTMLIIRHKTKHTGFMAGLPAIMVIELVLLLIVLGIEI